MKPLPFLYLVFILNVCFSTNFKAQTPYCISHELLENNAHYKQNFELINRSIFEATQAYERNQYRNSQLPTYTLPVVVHLIVPPGTPIGQGNNLTDAQVEAGLALLNQSFANSGAFNAPDGVDMNIRFCLAKRDPNGQPTNGITRNESPLVAETVPCSPFGTNAVNDVLIKSLNNWDCKRYINIWLVTDLFNNGFGCGLAGYAYFPGTGCNLDGIVQESRYWITTGGTRITAHEMGHYFGLNHTFSGACANADCLLDGDRVCDTPPDNSQSFAACNTNSCNTDSPDLPDDNRNYMDYSACSPPHFTAGQQVRAMMGLEKGRTSLTISNGCQPVANWDIALLEVTSNDLGCDPNFAPKLTIKNNGIQTITSIDVNYSLNGSPTQTITIPLNLASNASLTYTLPTQKLSIGIYTFSISLTNPNGNTDGYPSDNAAVLKFNVYPTPILSQTKITGTRCVSDGTVTLATTNGTPPYLYESPGNGLTQNDGLFTLLLSGNQRFIVTDANLCRDTIDVFVPDSCNVTVPNQFVLNGNALYLGGDCYRLTPAQTGTVGSIWYNKKIDLKRDFVAEFTMNLGCIDANGADGIAFVLQPISTAIGVAGGGLGYQGVQPSLVVEFDTWRNCCNNSTSVNSTEANDPFQDHVAIMRNGTVNHLSSNNLAGPVDIIPGSNAEDCNFHNIRIAWNATQQRITVFVDCLQRVTYQGDIVTTIFNNDPNVFFGFTAATGGSFNVQQVCLKYISFLDRIADQTICEGDKIQIAAPSDFATYQWTPTVGLNNPSSRNPIFAPTTTTTYIVAMTNQCGVITRDTIDVNVVNLEIELDTTVIAPCSVNPTLKLKVKNSIAGVSYAINNAVFYPNTNFIEDYEFRYNQNYTFYAKSGNCIISKTVKITPPKPLKDSLIFQQSKVCKQKGYVNLVGIGGVPPYQYSINGTVFQASGDFTNLEQGNYTIIVRDARGCEANRSIKIEDNAKTINLQIDSSRLQRDCYNDKAFVSVAASGTTPFYYYALDTFAFDTNPLFENLTDGLHTIIAQDDFGCLSDTLKINVVNRISSPEHRDSMTICEGKTFVYNGKVYSTQGVYKDTLINQYGCDSILFLTLRVLPKLNNAIKAAICAPSAYTLNNKTFSQSGIYTETLSAQNGCDSIVTLALTVNQPSSKTNVVTICEPNTYSINNKVYTSSGIYRDTLVGSEGCDSIIITQLTIFPRKNTQLNITICEGQSYTLNGKTYNNSGIYYDTLQTIRACDSIVRLTLNVAKSSSFSEKKSLCINEKLIINGIAITKSGSYDFMLKNSNLCDSLYTIDVAILDTSSYYQEFTLCPDDSLLIGKEVLKFSGIYKNVLKAENGCDSILTTKIKRGNSTFCEDKYCRIYIPNSFSPNDDKQNDYFEIFTPVATLAKLQIFDRWGDLQYEEISANPRWDGTSMRGGMMNNGVYVYVITGVCSNGKPFIKAGDVTLLR
jgi:gliding motility-associated-like protein